MPQNSPSQYPVAVASELDAVNTILSACGETPINSLDGRLPQDASMARNVLAETARSIQLEQWHFNTEEDFPLVPDINQEINIPYNMVGVHFDASDSHDVIIRGKRLYDRANHTYKFTETINAQVTWILPFEEMPEHWRWYCTVRAARKFQDRAIGSGDQHTFHSQDEMFARNLAVREDHLQGRYALPNGQSTSFLNGWRVGDTLKR